jgi:class 3 adenylate cyclase
MGKPVEFTDRGEVRLRGFDEDVRVFLASPIGNERRPGPQVERRLAAVLSADGVGYSARMAENPEATLRALHETRARVRHAVERHRGHVVDSPGDNLLAEFPSARDAVDSAMVIQRSHLGAPSTLSLRIGVHLGEVLVEHGRLYGDGVNVAARLEGLAETGGICITRPVHELMEATVQASFEDLGEQPIKNLKPVQVFRVRLRE